MKKGMAGIHFLFLFLLAAAFFCPAQAEAADYPGLKAAIICAYQNYETSLDATAYQVYNDEAGKKKISAIFEEVINETPYLFYTGREFAKEFDAGTKRISRIGLSYMKKYLSGDTVNVEKIKRTRKKLDIEINKAVAGIPSQMGSVEKALLLHDYLVQTVSYNDSASQAERISEVGALLNHKANCQGYAVTYAALLQKVGIPAKCISSDRMSHMWNLVSIGGRWYHVDVTWDDPLYSSGKKDKPGIVLHKNFLLGNSGIGGTGHHGFSANAKDARYDKKYWHQVKTAFWYEEGDWIYGTDTGVYFRTGIGGKAKRIVKGKASCLARYKGKKYYLLLDNSVCLLHTGSKKVVKLYQAPDAIQLVQLWYSDGEVCYRYQQNGGLHTVKKKVQADGRFLFPQ